MAESVVSSTVNDEDLPPDITASRPSWLYRRSRTPTPPPGEKPRLIYIYSNALYCCAKNKAMYCIVAVICHMLL